MMVYLYLVRDQWPPKDPFWAGDFLLEMGTMKMRIMIETYQLIKIVVQCNVERNCLFTKSLPFHSRV